MIDGRDGKDPSGPEQQTSAVQELARFSGHGLTIAVSTGLFLAAGWWVDGRVGTQPLFTILGALMGAAGGLYSMVQHLVLIPRAKESANADREKDGKRETQ